MGTKVFGPRACAGPGVWKIFLCAFLKPLLLRVCVSVCVRFRLGLRLGFRVPLILQSSSSSSLSHPQV
ncbi:hypothetical protein RIF29_08318 [Crotalaria pallida]|uniref:Uncharacterized protein n=1 Tax=Crotalaria pallida TaxID=3830 RepID=A0AAN9FQM0_CROPI